MKRLTKVAALLLGCSMATGVYADSAYDRSYFALDLFAVSHDDRAPNVDTDLGFGGRAGLGFQIGKRGATRTALEVNLVANPIRFKDADDGNQMAVMLDLIHGWDLGAVDPYLLAGVGIMQEEVGPYEAGFPAFEVGGGVALEMFDDGFLRLGASAMSVHNDNLPTGGDPFLDFRFNVGLVLPFAGEPTPAPAPAPAPKPVDSDGDGLVDSKDACPSTPASTADGCPPPAPVVKTDADNDGVYDSEDTCPGTLGGLKVDEKGCAVQTEAQSVVLKGVAFLPSSATLTPEAKTVLDTAATALSGDKSLKVELGGHSDSQGKDAANLALSQKRAESVRQYLIGKGIEGSRLTAKGYGETQPIADNNTVEGRKENRRVELKIVK